MSRDFHSQPIMGDLPATPWEAGGVTKDRFVTAGTEREGIFSLGDVNIFPASGPGPVAIAAGAEIAAQIVEAVNSHAALKARVHELEANERAYEEIIGKKTYREVADERESARKALEFIVDGYENQDVSHVDYRVKVCMVATDALEEISK